MSRSISSPRLDRLSADRMQAALGDNFLIGREIVICETTTSTNDSVWQLAQGDATEGLVVFAEHQTAGRGQRGNSWESAAGKGLWFSLLLRPNLPVTESAKLTQWAATSIAATISNRCHRRATIKPPNDVFVAERKVAGVLVEMRAQENGPHLAIVGIGLNVNQQPHDFSTTIRDRASSLAMLLHGPLDRNDLAIALLRNLDGTYKFVIPSESRDPVAVTFKVC